MLHHRTTDPVKRAEHIANREDKLYEQECYRRDAIVNEENQQLHELYYWHPISVRTEYISNWIDHWLDTYNQTLKELVGQ
jgi:hypothetical protein